jgi:hypothetical protein
MGYGVGPDIGSVFSFLFRNAGATKVGNHDRSDRIGRGYLLEAVYDYETSGYPMPAAEVGVYPVLGVFLIDCD